MSTTDPLDLLDQVLPTVVEAAPQVDEAGEVPAAAVDALRGSGLLGLTLPADVGGQGAGPVAFAEVTRRLAGGCGSTAMIYLMHISAAMPLAAAPPPALPEALPELASGRWLGTLAFSEKGSRSHFWAPVSQAIAETDDEVHIKASKSFVTSAGHAQVYVTSCLAPESTGPTDTDLYALTADDAGLEVAAPWQGLGLRGNASSPMTVDVDIDIERRLGPRGDGFRLMMEVVLPWFNLGNAAVSLGLARAALDAAVAHVRSARLDHLDSSLADLPTIRARLAKASVTLDAHEAFLREAARLVAEPDERTMPAVLGVKAAANDVALEVTDAAMRVCGGAAFSKHLAVERAFRDARAGHVMAPTADVLYEFYGRAMCGLDLF